MRELRNDHVTYIVRPKLAKQTNQISCLVGHVRRPAVIYVCKLTEEIPIPFGNVRANLQRSTEATEACL